MDERSGHGREGGAEARRWWRASGRVAVAAALSFVATAGLAGCASSGGLVAPAVTLVDLELVDATVFESTFEVAVRIANDNPEPLLVDGLVLSLELDGRGFGKGSTGERFEVPRLGSVVRNVEMRLSHVAIATKIRGVLSSKVVDYAITGKVYVVRPSGAVVGLPVDKQGRIDLSGGTIDAAETPTEG
ncbi:MAG: LEA type 2 family protein [Thermoanaerobaculales bacterium]|jgi:LEA14-like dessication related protein|nr:LEA type 2 family protein [Thermoanaerobaculales bacterium]